MLRQWQYTLLLIKISSDTTHYTGHFGSSYLLLPYTVILPKLFLNQTHALRVVRLSTERLGTMSKITWKPWELPSEWCRYEGFTFFPFHALLNEDILYIEILSWLRPDYFDTCKLRFYLEKELQKFCPSSLHCTCITMLQGWPFDLDGNRSNENYE